MPSGYDIPAELAAHLRIGTCSWKYDSWKGLVYEPDKRYRPDDYLPDYARYFNTVEIDQWFWSLFPTGARLPDPEAVKRYADSVPDDFRFTVKAPNAITLTHSYAKQPKGSERHTNEPNPYFLNMDLLKRFLETLEPMHVKLGPIMLQFEYLNKQKIPSMMAFLERLHVFFAKAPAGFQYAIETRCTCQPATGPPRSGETRYKRASHRAGVWDRCGGVSMDRARACGSEKDRRSPAAESADAPLLAKAKPHSGNYAAVFRR